MLALPLLDAPMLRRWLQKIAAALGGGSGRNQTAPETDRHATFEQLYTDYFASVYSYVRHQVPTDEAANEIVYLVFYRLWTQRLALDLIRPPLSCLYALARCALIDYFRHEGLENPLWKGIGAATATLTGPEGLEPPTF